jgi:Ca2+-binding EF-hand superfamily protein
MAYFGVDKHVRIKEQILQFQNIIRNRMTTSVRSLKGIFAQIDTNQSGSLDKQEFETALAAFG